MASLIQSKFKQCFPVPITIPDAAHAAQSVETLILAALATVAADTAPQGQPFDFRGKELTTVVLVPAGPIHWFHKNIAFSSRDWQIAYSAPIVASAEFSGYDALDWYKHAMVYTSSSDTGYGGGGLTTAIAYCLLS